MIERLTWSCDPLFSAYLVIIAATMPVRGGLLRSVEADVAASSLGGGPQALPWEMFRDQLGELLCDRRSAFAKRTRGRKRSNGGINFLSSAPRRRRRRSSRTRLLAMAIARAGASPRIAVPAKLRDPRSLLAAGQSWHAVSSSGSTPRSAEPSWHCLGVISVTVARRRRGGQVVSGRRERRK